MRQYVIDELSKKDVAKSTEYLNTHAQLSPVGGLYWIDLQEDILSPEQYSHEECKPFCFSIEVGEDLVKFEFLIRSKKTLRCSCIQYASRLQRDFIIGFAENMLLETGIAT
ncbi:MAG: hypothetical protein V1736_05985 [Pseudomonadota bacterium]